MLMAHVVVEPGMSMDQAANVLSQLQDCLREHFPVSIPHTTFSSNRRGTVRPAPNSCTPEWDAALRGLIRQWVG